MQTNPVAASTSVQITAAANGGSKSGTFTVSLNTPAGVAFSPSSVVGSRPSTGTITLLGPAAVDTPVTLAVVSGAAAVSSIAASLTVLAGQSSATFTVATNAVAASVAVQISATANGGTKTGTLTVTPNFPASVSFSPSSVVGGSSSTGTVSLGIAAAADTPMALTVVSGSAAMGSMPASVTVLAGQTSAKFTVVTKPVASTVAVQVSATANGGSKTGTLSVTP